MPDTDTVLLEILLGTGCTCAARYDTTRRMRMPKYACTHKYPGLSHPPTAVDTNRVVRGQANPPTPYPRLGGLALDQTEAVVGPSTSLMFPTNDTGVREVIEPSPKTAARKRSLVSPYPYIRVLKAKKPFSTGWAG